MPKTKITIEQMSKELADLHNTVEPSLEKCEAYEQWLREAEEDEIISAYFEAIEEIDEDQIIKESEE